MQESGAVPLTVSVEEFDEGVGFRRYLLNAFKRGTFTAKDVCAMAWHAERGGCHGVADLALDPCSTGGNFYTHLTRAVGLKSMECFYSAKIPLWNCDNQSRELTEFPFHLPHVIFHDLFVRRPLLFDPINIDFTEMPPCYSDHAVVMLHGAKAMPCSLYSDGVPHTKNDSFYCWYFKLLHDEERHLVCTVRKKRCLPMRVPRHLHLQWDRQSFGVVSHSAFTRPVACFGPYRQTPRSPWPVGRGRRWRPLRI